MRIKHIFTYKGNATFGFKDTENPKDYSYDATGTKLQKNVWQYQTPTITQYAGNYIYENTGSGSILQFFNHAEGYVKNDNGRFNYVYQYKDHLGNVRLTYTDANNNGSITPSEIIEESNYYPFGLKHKGYNSVISSNGNSVAQRWKFGGKEFNDELGLDWYDFSARNYDPALGRWMNLDPLAEHPNQIQNTPYHYALNNPILYEDPDGKCPPWICGAIAGALVEAGSQYIVNIAKGQDWVEAAKNIDGADVLAAGVEGGITGGGSVVRRLLVKGTTIVVSETVKASIDVKLNGDTDIVGTEGSKKSVESVVKDAAIGTTASVLGEGVESGIKGVTNSALKKEVKTVNKELKKSMTGSGGESTRLAKKEVLQSTIKQNEGAAKVYKEVTTPIVNEKLKKENQ